MSDENYSCCLTQKALQKAKEELGEDPDERLGAVQTLREWLQRESWINAPTGLKNKQEYFHTQCQHRLNLYLIGLNQELIACAT